MNMKYFIFTTRRKRGQRRHHQSGFTLLLAALVSSIVLAVGAAIFGIAQKQVILSAIGRDSQFAFYAADTAAECALYWDFRYRFFASTTPAEAPNPTCDGQTATPFDVTPAQSQPYAYPYTLTSQPMDFFQDIAIGSGNLCAEVKVTKCQGTFGANNVCTIGSVTDPIRTSIHADGYSTDCASIGTSARALQRSVELRY